jgi:hypothetical protein
VEGSLAFSSIQNVLGSDPASLTDPNSLVGAALTKPGTTSPDPTLCNSTYVMVKIAGAPGGGVDGGDVDGGDVDGGDVDGGDVDGGGVDGGGVDGGGGVSCEWVRANEASLFSQ